jgi:hypothetical protein
VIVGAPGLIVGAFNLLVAAPAAAAPDGAEWETASQPQGCLSCHFDSPDPSGSESLTIEGLPQRPEPGRSYSLTLGLRDATLKNAGFMLSVTAGDEPAGALHAVDSSTETAGAKARQTRAGTAPAEPGRSVWHLTWTAPARIDVPIRFDLWGNAGNDDQSPLGDTLHHRVWQLPAEP